MIRRAVIAMFVSALATIAAAPLAAAQAKATDPLDAYKEYLAVLAKATTLDSLLPYYTKELSDGLRKMPKDMQANYLKMNKQAVTGLKVTKQDVTATKASFELTAKDTSGQDLKGTAALVKEGGAWKVDDFAWIGPPPKG